METAKGECEHRCRNTCAMLIEAMQDEKKQIAYYETMLGACDDPAMKNFVKELIETHGLLVNQIKERLSIIKANAEVLDDIITGFEG